MDVDNPSFIHSPNYPKAYPKGISCIWEIRAPNGSVVNFNLTEFNNPSGKRRHSYRVYDLDGPGYLFGGTTDQKFVFLSYQLHPNPKLFQLHRIDGIH